MLWITLRCGLVLWWRMFIQRTLAEHGDVPVRRSVHDCATRENPPGSPARSANSDLRPQNPELWRSHPTSSPLFSLLAPFSSLPHMQSFFCVILRISQHFVLGRISSGFYFYMQTCAAGIYSLFEIEKG